MRILAISILFALSALGDERLDVLYRTTFGGANGIISLSTGRILEDRQVKRQYAILSARGLDGKLNSEFGEQGHLFLTLPGYDAVTVQDVTTNGKQIAILGERLWVDADSAKLARYIRPDDFDVDGSDPEAIAHLHQLPLAEATRLAEAAKKNRHFVMVVNAKTGETESLIDLKDLKPPVATNTARRNWMKDDATVGNLVLEDDGKILVAVEYPDIGEKQRPVIYRVLPDGRFDGRFGREGIVSLGSIQHPTDLVRDPKSGKLFVAGEAPGKNLVISEVNPRQGRAEPIFGAEEPVRTLVKYDPPTQQVVSLVTTANRVTIYSAENTGNAQVPHQWKLGHLFDSQKPGLLRLGGRLYFQGRDRDDRSSLVLAALPERGANPSANYKIDVDRMRSSFFCRDLVKRFQAELSSQD